MTRRTYSVLAAESFFVPERKIMYEIWSRGRSSSYEYFMVGAEATHNILFGAKRAHSNVNGRANTERRLQVPNRRLEGGFVVILCPM